MIPDPDQEPAGAQPAPPRWEHQPSESAKAYAAFAIYRDLGHLRSLRKAATQYYGQVTDSRLGQFKDWSKQHEWVARVEAWDGYLDEVSRVEQVENVKEMRRQYAQTARAVRNLVARDVVELNNSTDRKLLTPSEMARLLEVSQKVEAWAREVPGETVGHEHAVTVTLEEEKALAREMLDELARARQRRAASE